ncbi:hypothetical protein H6G27_19440 [Nostoc linckia FACHB-104]|nr:hypothetical protein [Nostoc linckia FACHB-104]
MISEKILATGVTLSLTQRQLLQRRKPHASSLKSGNPPTRLATQRTGSPT